MLRVAVHFTNDNVVHYHEVKGGKKGLLHSDLCFISAAQDGKNANQRQRHLGTIKQKLAFAALQSCISSGFAYSM